MTLSLHNMRLTSQKPCNTITSVIAVKQTVTNEIYVIFNKIEKIINFIDSVDETFRVIKIMDFNRTGYRCHSTVLPYARSGKYIVLHLTYF